MAVKKVAIEFAERHLEPLFIGSRGGSRARVIAIVVASIIDEMAVSAMKEGAEAMIGILRIPDVGELNTIVGKEGKPIELCAS